MPLDGTRLPEEVFQLRRREASDFLLANVNPFQFRISYWMHEGCGCFVGWLAQLAFDGWEMKHNTFMGAQPSYGNLRTLDAACAYFGLESDVAHRLFTGAGYERYAPSLQDVVDALMAAPVALRQVEVDA